MSLKVKNLGFYYEKDEWIFKDLNFELAQGEILGIFGYSGCGKSSLAKVLADFQNPICGEVIIDDKVHQKNSFREVQLIINILKK
ncbi:Uncharacterized ABC transporter ATP-binding protein HI_1470 [Streptobacillus moniliformis]|nr:Uncharacterized ABC transporter ATP-binding protein HI_1470 [Streptobacillus moniliformis]